MEIAYIIEKIFFFHLRIMKNGFKQPLHKLPRQHILERPLYQGHVYFPLRFSVKKKSILFYILMPRAKHFIRCHCKMDIAYKFLNILERMAEFLIILCNNVRH